MPGIYLRHGDRYVAMTETAYDQESVLQALIAQNPELLTDEDAGQGPLLFIRREADVVDREDGAGRWSLDHLYVDAEGVPTLVEVKRSSDTRVRREVVAQMLDYAANAKLSFNVERMTAWLEEDARAHGTTGSALLSTTLGIEDRDSFRELVATNLDAERFRLIFISDVIPPELQRIIEFLNGQMTRTDVLAIEVKQYVDERGEHQTIVPRVIGNTEKAKATKRARSATSRGDLLEALGDDALAAAEALLAWVDGHPQLTVHWTRAADIGVGPRRRTLLRIWDKGTLELKVNTLRHLSAPLHGTTSASSGSSNASSTSTASPSRATAGSGPAHPSHASPMRKLGNSFYSSSTSSFARSRQLTCRPLPTNYANQPVDGSVRTRPSGFFRAGLTLVATRACGINWRGRATMPLGRNGAAARAAVRVLPVARRSSKRPR